MAKDGTSRGGNRPGAGRKSKAATEKLATGNPGHRPITIIDTDNTNPQCYEMPPVEEYMKARQKDGRDLKAEEIYISTWKWLCSFKCEKLIAPQLLSQYAMVCARLINCEEAISEYGYLLKRANGSAATSPYVTMSNEYRKQANQLYYQIYQVVKENSSIEINGDHDPQSELMEKLLRARKG